MSKRSIDEIMAEWKELERVFRIRTRELNKEYLESLDETLDKEEKNEPR